jgi:hypothetical protein
LDREWTLRHLGLRKVAWISVNARRKGRSQPIYKCVDKLVRKGALAALAVADEHTELARDWRCILPEVVEVLGDEHPRMLSVLLSVTRSSVEERGVLYPSASISSIVDIVAAGLT